MDSITGTTIGSALRQRRRARGMSQADVSAGICSVSYLSLIEADKRTPDERVLQQLLARLDLESLESGESQAAIDPLSAAEVALRLGDIAQAENFLTRVPATPRSSLIRALIHEVRGDSTAACELLGRLSEDPAVPKDVAIQARTALCRCLLDAGEIESARNAGEMALQLATQSPTEWASELVELRATLAGVYCESGDLFRARQLTAEAVAAADESPWQRASRDWSRALVCNAAGDFANAGIHARNALRRLRDLDKPRSEANLLQTAVWVELQSGTYDELACRADLSRAEQTLRSMHAEVELGMCLSTWAELESMEGDRARAARLVEEALRLVPETVAGIRARILVGAAVCSLRAGDLAGSRSHLLEARELLESSGATRSAAISWRQMGAVFEELGEIDLAYACVKAASDLVGLGAHVIQPARTVGTRR